MYFVYMCVTDGTGDVNPLGVAYYNNLIDALVEASKSRRGASFVDAVTIFDFV